MLLTVHIFMYMLLEFVGNNSQDCEESKQTSEQKTVNEGNCKIYHLIEKTSQNTQEGKLESC